MGNADVAAIAQILSSFIILNIVITADMPSELHRLLGFDDVDIRQQQQQRQQQVATTTTASTTTTRTNNDNSRQLNVTSDDGCCRCLS